MPTEIVITAGDLKLEGVLNDSPTAQALAEALPITGDAQLWGDEIYFQVPKVVAELDDTATPVVQVGDLGYWPTRPGLLPVFRPHPGQRPGGDPPGQPRQPGGPPLRRPLLPQTGPRRRQGAD